MKCYVEWIALFVIFVSFGAQHVGSQSLVVSQRDITLTLDHNKNFSIQLDQAVDSAVQVHFNFTSDKIVNVTSSEIIQANSTDPLDVQLRPIHAGKTTILLIANPLSPLNISIGDSFVRVSVIYLEWLEVFSSVVGWIYFVAWSVSFYPQVYSNYKRKSVAGLNFDFLALNITGFLAYSAFNIGLYFSPTVQAEYMIGHPTGVIPVELNDVVFGLHAAFASALQIIQCFIYERNGQVVSKLAKATLAAIWLAGVIFLIVTWAGGNPHLPWLTFLYYFSYCKLGITIVKYMPQAYFNFRRKSTSGWSIGNILLDFTGGILSMLQMFVIAYNYNDWKSLFGNPTKFGLGFFSILFDVLFMTQHYCLYRKRASSRDPLCDVLDRSTTTTTTNPNSAA